MSAQPTLSHNKSTDIEELALVAKPGRMDPYFQAGGTSAFDEAWQMEAPQDYSLNVSGDELAFGVDRGPLRIDLGAVPTVVQPEAQHFLSHLPSDALKGLLAEIRSWVEDRAEVRRARVLAVSEPEDPQWTEVIVELRLEADTQHALDLWDEIAGRVDRVKKNLNEQERELISRSFGVHLVWFEDDDGEE